MDIPTYSESHFDKAFDYLQTIIRPAYGGDLDEFILECISWVQQFCVEEYHEKIAKIRGYELYGYTDFDNALPPAEIWRRIFPLYFDEEEDSYPMFFGTYTQWCVLFFLADYVDHVVDISYIPLFNVFSTDGFKTVSDNILAFIKPEVITKEIKRLYGFNIEQRRVVQDE
jgi:hypothetical protein